MYLLGILGILAFGYGHNIAFYCGENVYSAWILIHIIIDRVLILSKWILYKETTTMDPCYRCCRLHWLYTTDVSVSIMGVLSYYPRYPYVCTFNTHGSAFLRMALFPEKSKCTWIQYTSFFIFKSSSRHCYLCCRPVCLFMHCKYHTYYGTR